MKKKSTKEKLQCALWTIVLAAIAMVEVLLGI